MEETELAAESPTLTLNVTVEEANLVLAALQELPHKLVHSLIQKVLEQANQQIKAPE